MTELVVFAFTTKVGVVYSHHTMHLLKPFPEDGAHLVKEVGFDGSGRFFGLMSIGDAVESTGLAAVTVSSGKIRVYDQTLHLHLSRRIIAGTSADGS